MSRPLTAGCVNLAARLRIKMRTKFVKLLFIALHFLLFYSFCSIAGHNFMMPRMTGLDPDCCSIVLSPAIDLKPMEDK